MGRRGSTRGPSSGVGLFDITLAKARQLTLEIVGPGNGQPEGQIPFTPRAKKVLELSLREALGLGHRAVRPEHLLRRAIR